MITINHIAYKLIVCFFLFLSLSFTIKATTLPYINPIANKIICNEIATDTIPFTGTGTIYKWTNDNPSIGLAASGTGTIPSFTAINTGTSPVTANITVTPAIMNDASYIYVSDVFSNTVSVIKTATNSVTTSIPVGIDPAEISISPDNNLVYVSNSTSNTVSVISTATNTVVATIPVGNDPLGSVFSPNRTLAYIANFLSSDVSVVNTTTNAVIATIPLGGGEPYAITISPDGNWLYVANYISNTVSVINTTTTTITATISLGGEPWCMAINPDGTYLYVANTSSNSIIVISTNSNTIIKSIPVGTYPSGVSINTDGSRLYVSNNGSNTVSVINTSTNGVIATIPVGKEPWANTISFDGSRLYVANSASNTVSVIDALTNKVITTIPVNNPLYITKPCNVMLIGTPKTFTITVNPTIIPSVDITSTATTICSNTSVTFTAIPTNGGTSPSYQWKLNNVNVGTNSNIYTTDTLKNNDIVSCVMNSDADCPSPTLVTSNAITMKVNATSTSTTNQTICPEALPYTWNGNNYSGAGTYTTHLTNAADCDSVATLMLTVTTPTSTTQASICQGQNYTFNETSYNTVGTYSVHIPTSNGCDSLAILQLKVNQPTTSTTNASICQGDNYTFNSTPYNATGTYIAHLINSNGCDSTATLHLTMNITKQTTINEEICSNETYSFGIKTLNQSGTYTETLSSSASCDSTVTLHLTVKPAYEQTREIRLVYGEKDTIEGKIYDEPGTFTETHTAVNGCDSTIITTVTLVKTHCPQVVIPAFFSPNGDGVDDIWQIENLSCYSASVDIYDRYGKRVAHYSGTDSGWDGTYLGHTEPSADYWYVIVLHDIDEKRVGHFTLKR